jgi:hypothetical protein
VTCHAIELRTFGLQKTIKRLGLRDHAYDSGGQTALSGTLSEIVGKPVLVSDWQARHRSAPLNHEIRDCVWGNKHQSLLEEEFAESGDQGSAASQGWPEPGRNLPKFRSPECPNIADFRDWNQRPFCAPGVHLHQYMSGFFDFGTRRRFIS